MGVLLDFYLLLVKDSQSWDYDGDGVLIGELYCFVSLFSPLSTRAPFLPSSRLPLSLCVSLSRPHHPSVDLLAHGSSSAKHSFHTKRG